MLALAARMIDQLHERSAALAAAPATLEELKANAQTVLGANCLLLPHLTPPDAGR